LTANAAPTDTRQRFGAHGAAVGWAIFAVANAQRIAVVPFFTEFRHYYHTNYTAVGALLSAYLLGYLLAQVPMGLAADNLPTRRVTLAGLALICLTSGLFAITGSYWTAMGLRFLMGVSGAALYASTVKLLLGSASRRGAAMGVLQSGAGTGMIVGLFVLPLAAQLTELRTAFLGLAAASGAVLVYGAVFLPPGARADAAGGTMGEQLGTVIRERRFPYFAASTFLILFGSYGLTAWLPTYLRVSFQFTGAAAGAVVSLKNVALAVVSPWAGVLSDRLGVRAPVILAGFGVLALAFAILLGTHTAGMVWVSAVVSGIGTALTLPVVTTSIADVFGIQRAGLAVSFNLAVGQIASTISGVLFGYLLDLTGRFDLLWGLGMVVALAGVAPAAALWRTSDVRPAASRPGSSANPDAGAASSTARRSRTDR